MSLHRSLNQPKLDPNHGNTCNRAVDLKRMAVFKKSQPVGQPYATKEVQLRQKSDLIHSSFFLLLLLFINCLVDHHYWHPVVSGMIYLEALSWYRSGFPNKFCAKNSRTMAMPNGRAMCGLRKYVLGWMLVITSAHLDIMESPLRCISDATASSRMGYLQCHGQRCVLRAAVGKSIGL